MNEQFSEADIKKFQKGKQQKRSIASLDNEQVIEFASLLQKKAPPGDFELRLNMSSADIEYHKENLGFVNDDTIDDFLKAINDQQADLDKLQAVKNEDGERQKRLDALNATKQDKTSPKKDKVVTHTSSKEQQEALDRLESEKNKTKPVLQYDSMEHYKQVTGKRFRISPSESKAGLSREEAFIQRFKEPSFTVPKDEEEQFKLDSRLGMRMLCDKYGVKRSEITAELKRLNINTDMLLR